MDQSDIVNPPILRPSLRSSLIEASHENLAGSWYFHLLLLFLKNYLTDFCYYWYFSVPSPESITMRKMILDKENYFVDQIRTKLRNYSESHKTITSGVYINGKPE